MIVAVALQVCAVVGWIAGGFVLARWGGAEMAATVPLFLFGWTLEQRLAQRRGGS